ADDGGLPAAPGRACRDAAALDGRLPEDGRLVPETPPADDPDVMDGEVITTATLDLPVLEEKVSKAQAEAYADAWATLYKTLDKAGRDRLWSETEDDVDRVGKISSKAMDVCNDALNSPAE
ncbi:MAG TPA: hypothetical protein DCL54_03360, partial [Alphaproteobacteria bacterium]|nr:hypothetical protein [Alphaproteobacteria bacterium]